MYTTKKKQHYWLDYIFVFILVIYAGNATTFVRSLDTWENALGLFLPIILTTYKIMAAIHAVQIKGILKWINVGTTVSHI